MHACTLTWWGRREHIWYLQMVLEESFFTSVLNKSRRNGQMAQKFRALVALTVNPGSVPCTHKETPILHNSSSRQTYALFCTSAHVCTPGVHTVHIYKTCKTLIFIKYSKQPRFLPHPEPLGLLSHLHPSDWKWGICLSCLSWYEYVHVCKENTLLISELIADQWGSK